MKTLNRKIFCLGILVLFLFSVSLATMPRAKAETTPLKTYSYTDFNGFTERVYTDIGATNTNYTINMTTLVTNTEYEGEYVHAIIVLNWTAVDFDEGLGDYIQVDFTQYFDGSGTIVETYGQVGLDSFDKGTNGLDPAIDNTTLADMNVSLYFAEDGNLIISIPYLDALTGAVWMNTSLLTGTYDYLPSSVSIYTDADPVDGQFTSGDVVISTDIEEPEPTPEPTPTAIPTPTPELVSVIGDSGIGALALVSIVMIINAAAIIIGAVFMIKTGKGDMTSLLILIVTIIIIDIMVLLGVVIISGIQSATQGIA
jgi:hypothetical protein